MKNGWIFHGKLLNNQMVYQEHIWLVVWNMAFMTFHILGIIIPTDALIFFRGVETTNQICSKQRIKSFSRNDSDNHAENGEHVDMFSQDMIRNIGYTNMNGIMIELNINTC